MNKDLLAIAKPILFNTEMVQAILSGRKTHTRRVIKPKYRNDEYGFQVITTRIGEFVRVEKVDENECAIFADGTERYVTPPYQPSDILYVRETWAKNAYGGYFYKANNKCEVFSWNPSIHMPKEAARTLLRVTSVTVERLQDITPKQCIMEGVEPQDLEIGDEFVRWVFNCLWDSTIKPADIEKYGWDANPWVWDIGFEVVT